MSIFVGRWSFRIWSATTKKHSELRVHRAKNKHGDLVFLLQVLNCLYMADNSVPNLKKICIAHPIQGNYLEAASTYLVQLWYKKWISKNLFCQWIIQSNYFASQDSSVNRSPTTCIPNITRMLNKALIAFTTGCRPGPALQRIGVNWKKNQIHWLGASAARGRYFRNFWVGMCRWDPGILNLYQS